MKYVWIAAVIGIALGVGLGPIVAACIDTTEVSPLSEPSVYLSTVSAKLHAFLARVTDLRARDLAALTNWSAARIPATGSIPPAP